jgi:hypothetical protein
MQSAKIDAAWQVLLIEASSLFSWVHILSDQGRGGLPEYIVTPSRAMLRYACGPESTN